MEKRAWQVIIADDIETNRLFIRSFLKQLPVIFFDAQDGSEVMELLSRQEIDLVVLDLMMPRQDGFSVLEQMKCHSEYRHIPVIVQSVLEAQDTISKALEMGAYDYFIKFRDNNLVHKDLLLKAKNAIQTYSYHKQLKKEIAQRQQVELRLRASEHIAHSLLENMPYAIAVVNSTEQVIYVNKVLKEIFAYDLPQGAKLENLLQVLFTETAERERALAVVRRVVQRVAKGLKARPLVFTAGKNGQHPPVYEAKVNGAGENFIWQLADITGMKRREARIKAAMSLLRDFTRSIPDKSSFIIDGSGRILDEFGGLENIACCDQPYAGKSVYNVFPPHEAGVLLTAAVKVLSDGASAFLEMEVLTESSRKLYEVCMAILQHPEFTRGAVAVTMTNVTGQRQSERNLRLSFGRQRRREIFGDLIHGRISPEQAAEKLSTAGIAVQMPCTVMVLAIKRVQQSTAARTGDDDKLLVDSIVDELSSADDIIAWECQTNMIIVMWQHKLPNVAKEEEISFASDLANMVKMFSADCTVGIAGNCDNLAQLAHCYDNAISALAADSLQKEHSPVCHFLDAGVMQILSPFASRREAREYVDRILGRLIEHDQNRGLGLMETLEKLLFGKSIKDVANELFVHTKTIYFRKRRIEAITGMSIDNFEDRLAISLAYKLWLYLNQLDKSGESA